VLKRKGKARERKRKREREGGIERGEWRMKGSGHNSQPHPKAG
jgi:hypothetical protein